MLHNYCNIHSAQGCLTSMKDVDKDRANTETLIEVYVADVDTTGNTVSS